MGVTDLFSKRQKRLRGELPDVYVYDEILNGLRVQVCHILNDTLGEGGPHHGNSQEAYKRIAETLCREYGVFVLPPTRNRQHYGEELINFILKEVEVERVIDAIELSFRLIDNGTRVYGFLERHDASERADAAIEELNGRFREHGIGFEYSNGQMLRIDSEYVHAEVVKPALTVLSEPKYEGAQQEFLAAHAHYRAGNAKECLNDCLKAFESTMKAICDSRGWSYKKGATSKDLIQTCLNNELVPDFWQQHFTSLRQELESSVPTGRNKLGGHGQGSVPVEVPLYLAAYMLHMTASTIVFLGNADSELR